MIPKTCNLHPTCTTVVSETNCCCHLLPRLSGFVDVNWAVPLWLPVISEFISVPRRSASSFNSNTVRFGDKLPQFGWVWSNLQMHKWVDCWLRPCGASTRNMSWGGMKLHVQFVWKHVVILHRFATTTNAPSASRRSPPAWKGSGLAEFQFILWVGVHFPETWKIGAFQYVTYGGPLEFWRGVHNVSLHYFLNVLMFFEDAISFDEPVTKM